MSHVITQLFLGNLPYLLVLIVGITLAANKRQIHPQLASWAAVCYGALIVLWILRILQTGWIIWAHQQGMNIDEHEDLLTGLGYLRMAAHYCVLAALVFGAFRWRDAQDDPYRKPGILVAIFIILYILGIVIGRSLTTAGPLSILVMVAHLGSMIALMAAFFGWRNDRYLPIAAGEKIADSSSVPGSKPAITQAPQPAVVPSGMFEEKDYIPFILGIMILGGLVCVPILWGQFTGIGYEKSIIPSLVSCAIFVYAHDNRGNFSVLKFVIGLAFMFMVMMRALAHSAGGAKPMFFAGGIFGYLVMLVCGWAGILAARTLRR